MRILILSALFFIASISLADEVIYVLTSEFSLDKDKGLLTEDSHHPEGDNNIGTDLLEDYFVGYSIYNDVIYKLIGNQKYGEVGKVNDCNGYGGKCLVIDGFISIFIPRGIGDGKVLSWEWDGYRYKSAITRNYSLVGVDLNVIEVSGSCDSCYFRDVWFSLDLSYGVVSFTLKSESSLLAFTLGSSRGFLSKE